ncbi:hypothetical protein [Microbacterium hydrocarbonoxydans]|uniref:hypothetical protein n=1 Tax=Microbacterium hydrocarbonoxydans TaxID=273678 RepID=UPI003D97FEE7
MSIFSGERRAERAAIRDARSGAGPTREGVEPGPNPGAVAKFGLFGEVLTIGLMMALVALPVVTLPIALAAGIRHIRRFVAAEDSRASFFWADVRAGLLRSLALGVPAALLAGVLAIDILLAGSGALPGGQIVGLVGWAGLLVLAVALLISAGEWEPELGWRAAVRAVPQVAFGDAVGTLYLAATAVFVGVVTWMLGPLLIAGLGCAALAVIAVPERRIPERRIR